MSIAPLVQWFSMEYKATSKSQPKFNHSDAIEYHYFDNKKDQILRVKQQIAFEYNTKVRKLPKDLVIEILK